MLIFVKTSLILFSAKSCMFLCQLSATQILTGLCGTPKTDEWKFYVWNFDQC